MNTGAFGENFPYSNFHDLNTDWIIKIAKDFLDQYTHIQEIISTGEESLQNLTTDGLKQLQTKADALEALLQEWYNTHSEDIAQQLADAISSINTTLNTTLAEFATRAKQKAQETLEDIPDDYTQVANEITVMKNGLVKGFAPHTYQKGYLNTSGALVSSATDWWTSPFYPLVANIVGIKGAVNSLSGIGYNICFYDANRNFISGKLATASIVENAVEIIAPNNAKLFRFSNHSSLISDNNIYFIYDRTETAVIADHYRRKLVNLKNDGYINTSGNLVGADPWGTTNFIYVHNIPYIGLEGIVNNLGAVGYNVSLYDKDFRFMKGFGIYNNNVMFPGYRIETENAYYIRISSTRDLPAYLVYSYMGCFKNLIDRDDCIEGYYVDYATGKIFANSAFSVTPYIPVSPGGTYRYTIKLDTGNEYAIQQCAFYDENMNYVSGLTNAGATHSTNVDVPPTAYYIRWTIKNHYTKIQLEPGIVETDFELYYPYDEDPAPCYVGSTRKITSLLVALKELPAKVPIILDSETFNILTEYTDYYGAGYWTNYNGYVTADPFDRGLWLAHGRKLSGTARTLIKCLHDNSNENVTRYFSVFANAEDVVMENLFIEMSNVRYAIHDDFSNDVGNGTIVFRNIKFIGSSTGQVIGAGMGYNNTYIIENCLFRITNGTWDIHYHNSTSGRADNINRIYVRNCWGYRDIGVEAYGQAQTMSTMMVSACKFRDYREYRPEDTTVAPYMNVEIVAWAND